MSNLRKLSNKEEFFCKEYTKDLNGSQACIRAGYSARSAKEQASRLLTKDNIQARLKELLSERAERCEITADMVLKEYAKIAFIDIREFYHEDGRLKLPHEMSDAAAASLSSIEVDEIWGYDIMLEAQVKQGETKKIRMHNKLAALQDVGKHLGMFEKDNQQKAFVPGNIKIEIIPPTKE